MPDELHTTIIGTGEAEKLPTEVAVVTDNPMVPSLVVSVVNPIVAIAIRLVNVFLLTFLGILTGAMTTNVITAPDFLHLAFKCAGLSIAGTSLALIKDLITVFGKLEHKYPLLTGSV